MFISDSLVVIMKYNRINIEIYLYNCHKFDELKNYFCTMTD